jgi:outer membrane protein OmpA-like peptidoglycan-associated protein
MAVARISTEASMRDELRFPAPLRQGIQARWGGQPQWANFGRYVGPVFAMDGLLAQRIGERVVVVHRLSQLDFGSSDCLKRRAAEQRLNDLVLSIYHVGDRSLVYLRSRRTKRLTRIVPAVSPHPHSGKARAPAMRAGTSALAVSLVLAACASNDALVTPNGSRRVPVNTPETLASYHDLLARQAASQAQKSALELKVERMDAEISALKASLEAQRQNAAESAPVSSTVATPSLALPRPPPESPRVLPTGNHDEIAAATASLEADRVIFRIHHAAGHTEFSPPTEIEASLIKAARSAKSVWIRARTDAQVSDPLEARIALDRSLHARSFLITHGVAAQKIRTWYRSSGDFIAEDVSAEGRALNRRVDIEVRGLDTMALAALAATDQGGKRP